MTPLTSPVCEIRTQLGPFGSRLPSSSGRLAFIDSSTSDANSAHGPLSGRVPFLDEAATGRTPSSAGGLRSMIAPTSAPHGNDAATAIHLRVQFARRADGLCSRK